MGHKHTAIFIRAEPLFPLPILLLVLSILRKFLFCSITKFLTISLPLRLLNPPPSSTTTTVRPHLYTPSCVLPYLPPSWLEGHRSGSLHDSIGYIYASSPSACRLDLCLIAIVVLHWFLILCVCEYGTKEREHMRWREEEQGEGKFREGAGWTKIWFHW